MLKVTESAAQRIREVLAERPDEFAGLRVGLKDGGCSGYTYLVDFEDQPDEDDVVIDVGGVKVFVHPLHAPFLAGSVLTWETDKFQAGFQLENPNVKRMCGCGESFEV